MSHLSSLAPFRFGLLNGEMPSGACLAARFGVGDCEAGDRSMPQFSLCDIGCNEAHGRLMWDADHARNGKASPFFSVAPVRLEMKSTGECRLAVGTADFVSLSTRPYRWIERVQVGAAAGTRTPGRALNWDLLEVVFCYGDGRTETCRSTCLPAVATGAGVRRAAQASGPIQERLAGQYAEATTGSRDVCGIKLRGQVTLRANEGPAAASPLCPEDLRGQIAVFTDAYRRDD